MRSRTDPTFQNGRILQWKAEHGVSSHLYKHEEKLVDILIDVVPI